MASPFEGDDHIVLTKTEAFRVLAALMDAIELMDRTSPGFQISWERLRTSVALLADRIWPDE